MRAMTVIRTAETGRFESQAEYCCVDMLKNPARAVFEFRRWNEKRVKSLH